MSDARKAASPGQGRTRWLPATVLVAAGALVPLGTTTADAAPARGGDATLIVATTGADSGNCQSSPCRSLGYALTKATANDRVVIRPGTYPESKAMPNLVGPSLTGLRITASPVSASVVIDATGNANGIVVQANGVSVTGLTVENANLEGILAEPPPSTWPTASKPTPVGISGLTIAHNLVENNDRAYNATTHLCPSPTDNDDCGEGIHLLGVNRSRVIHNTVMHNVGGILLTDGGLPVSASAAPTPVGPASHNLIAYNNSSNNAYDCGITLPGHDPSAVATSGPSEGKPQPSRAGVYDNRVVHNVTNDNGGAGLLDATPYPGTGSYGNLFYANIAHGNGLAGFTLHSHAPLQEVGRIRVVDNQFGQNNTGGDPDTGVNATTGVMLLSVAVPTSIVVTGNTIVSDVNGIAANANVSVRGQNRFANVTSEYLSYTPPAPTSGP